MSGNSSNELKSDWPVRRRHVLTSVTLRLSHVQPRRPQSPQTQRLQEYKARIMRSGAHAADLYASLAAAMRRLATEPDAVSASSRRIHCMRADRPTPFPV